MLESVIICICMHTHFYDGVSRAQGSAQIHCVPKSDLDFCPSCLYFLTAGVTAVCYTWFMYLAGSLHPECAPPPRYSMPSTSSCNKRQLVASTGSCLRDCWDTISSNPALQGPHRKKLEVSKRMDPTGGQGLYIQLFGSIADSAPLNRLVKKHIIIVIIFEVHQEKKIS